MSWQFVVPGQPPSVNHMYARTRAGGVRKSSGVEAYQAGVTLIARTSRPSGWKYDFGFVRLEYEFRLKRDIDCDNLLKALNDAIAVALEMNDRFFLPCVKSKEIGVKDPDVRVTVVYK
jgi:Holliday junction resolvase RusA-like endonuclease